MGLEAINYYYRSKEKAGRLLKDFGAQLHPDESRYPVLTGDDYFIEFELYDEHTISIRITLSNPQIPVLNKLKQLLTYLLVENEGVLKDLHTKQSHHMLNETTWALIERSYHSKKSLFEERYGHIVAAVSSSQFRDMRRGDGSNKQ